MMMIEEKFQFGQVVFLVTDTEQHPRMVTGIVARPYGLVEYRLTCGTEETPHFEMEISAEKNILLTT